LRERQSKREITQDTFNQRDNVNIESVWCDRNTDLELIVWNSDTNATTARVQYRMLLPNGDVVDRRQNLTITSDRVQNISIFSPGTGWLISALVSIPGAQPFRGQTYCTLIVRNIKDGANTGVLFQGYVTGSEFPSYPQKTNDASYSGKGAIRHITGTDPAAGNDWLETVPTNAVWEIISVMIDLVTNATIGNRGIRFEVTDGTTKLIRIGKPANQAATTTQTYLYTTAGFQIDSESSFHHQGLPQGLCLPQGFTIGSQATGFQAGDNFGAPHLIVKEWIQE